MRVIYPFEPRLLHLAKQLLLLCFGLLHLKNENWILRVDPAGKPIWFVAPNVSEVELAW